MTRQRLVCTSKRCAVVVGGEQFWYNVFHGSSLKCEYDIDCSLFLNIMLLKSLSVRYMRTKRRVINNYILRTAMLLYTVSLRLPVLYD